MKTGDLVDTPERGTARVLWIRPERLKPWERRRTTRSAQRLIATVEHTDGSGRAVYYLNRLKEADDAESAPTAE